MGASDLTSAAIYNQFLNDFLCSSHLSSNHEAKKAFASSRMPLRTRASGVQSCAANQGTPNGALGAHQVFFPRATLIPRH